MPIGQGQFSGSTQLKSEGQQLLDGYNNLQARYHSNHLEQLRLNQEGAIKQFGMSALRGGQEGVKNIVNLIPDLTGFNKWATFEGISPREGFLNQSVEGIASFATAWPAGGPVAKGLVKVAKAAKGAKGAKAATTGFKPRLTKKEYYKQQAGMGLLQGGVADFAAFDANDSLVMHLLNSHPDMHDAYAEITGKEGWQNMSRAELVKATQSLDSFSMERMAKNWGGRGANVAEGAIIGSFLNVFWGAAKLKWNSDALTKGAIEGTDEAIKRGVDKTEKDGIVVINKSEKELQEETAFRHTRMAKEGEVTPEQLAKLKEDDAALAEASADYAATADDLRDRTPHAEIDEDEALAPKDWDRMDEQKAYGDLENVIPDEAWEKGRVKHSEEFKPTVEYVSGDLPAISSTVNGADNALIQINRQALADEWAKEGTTVLERKYSKGAFNNIDELEAFALAREAAQIKYSKLQKESHAGYQNRIDRAAANTMKRKGIGNFWLYEQDALKGMKQFQIDEDILMGKLFKNPEDMKKLLNDLVKSRKGQGKDLNKMFIKAQEMINIDSTMTSGGQKYFSARLMQFMMRSMRKGLGDKASKDPVSDQLAKALQWTADHESRLSAADFVQQSTMNNIDEIATARGLSPQGVAERLRKGRGDYKELFPEIKSKTKSVDTALKEDAAVMKEMYIRTWAYRLDQVVSMRQIEQLSSEIVDGGGLKNLTPAQGAKFAAQIELLEAKLRSFRDLATGQGRALAANKAVKEVGLGGSEQIYDEIVNKAGGLKGLAELASRIDAIKNGNKGNPAAAAAAAQGLLNKSVTGIDVHNEYWLNSVLSGARTQVVNTIGTALHAAYKPMEGLLGAVGGDAAAKRVFIKQAVYSANLLFETIKTAGALGLNKGSKVLGAIDHDAYMKKRGQIFSEGGDGAAVVAGGRKSMRSGKATLESRSEIFDVTPAKAISGDLLGDSSGKWAKDALDYIGDIVRVPSRFMITTDEVFKQIQFRSMSMAKLTGEALENLPKAHHTTDHISDYVSKRFQGMVRSNGARFTPDIVKDEAYRNYFQAVAKAENDGTPLPAEFQNKKQYIDQYVNDNYTAHADKGELSDFAMDWAEDTTFTRALDADLTELQGKHNLLLGESSAHKAFQDMVSQHSWMRVVAPFIRTPINLLKFPLQRMPVGYTRELTEKTRFLKKTHLRYQADMLSGDPVRKAQAMGRIRAGKLMYTSIAALAAMDMVTGQGPTDPAKRRALMATGWRPYSFKVGTRWVSYARLDPFSTVIGLAADTTEFLKEAGRDGSLDEKFGQPLILAGVYSLSNNIANKSYLSGMSRILNTLIDPVGSGNFDQFVQKQGASYIPKAVSQFTVLTDDGYMKKTYGLLEAMKREIPLLSGSIEPMRNYLGDKMDYIDPSLLSRATSIFNPFLSSKYKHDTVLDRLADMNYGFQAPEAKIRGKSFLDMRKFKDEQGRSAYDYYQERVGKIVLGGKTLRERLELYFNSKHYLNATKFEQKEGFESLGGDPRVKAVKSITDSYRRKSKRETLAKYPELQATIKAYERQYSDTMKEIFSSR